MFDWNIENITGISGLQPDRLIKYYVSDNACQAEVVLPGIWYTDFDRKIGGTWMLSSIVKTFEAIQYAVLPKGFINYSKLRTQNYFIFMAGAVYNFSIGVHKLSSKTHWGPLFPIRARISLSHVGASSFTVDIVMLSESTGEQLASSLTKFVYIDFITRKPSPLPSWFLEYQKNVDNSLNKTVEKPKLLKIPEKFDTDNNGHVTQSTYVRWCSDVGSFAATSGYYRNLSEDLGVYPLASLETYYLHEMQAEDRAVVHTWQDETNFRKLYFCVTKSSKPVFQAHFHFLSDCPFESPFVKSKI
ncbi:hypothetical protein ACJMK2_022097 [Sinanodonta woodiana]|uniref:Uncharacterized protein n=1 Tax=Sinanodonta woodiana TaxID=1069815 RepID=A0ABD3TI53_SINWO